MLFVYILATWCVTVASNNIVRTLKHPDKLINTMHRLCYESVIWAVKGNIRGLGLARTASDREVDPICLESNLFISAERGSHGKKEPENGKK